MLHQHRKRTQMCRLSHLCTSSCQCVLAVVVSIITSHAPSPPPHILYLDSVVSGPRQPGPGLHILVVIFSVQGPAHSGDEQYGGGCSDHARDQIAGTRALTLDVHFTGTATIGVGLAVLPAHRGIIRRAQKNWHKSRVKPF